VLCALQPRSFRFPSLFPAFLVNDFLTFFVTDNVVF
jgi:hypothetical protein